MKNYEHKELTFLVVILVLAALVVLLFGEKLFTNPENEGFTAGAVASPMAEIESTACSAAHDAGTCDTKLVELGIITRAKCCEIYNKCCS